MATTTTNSAPWAGQEPYLQDIFAQSRGQFEGPGPQYYSGNTVAGFTPAQQAAQQAIMTRAAQGSPLNQAAQDTALYTMGGGFLGANPAMQGFQNVATGGLTNPTLQGFQDVYGGALQNTGANAAIQGLQNAGMGPGASTFQNMTQSGLGPAAGTFQGLMNAGMGPGTDFLSNLMGGGFGQGPGGSWYANAGGGANPALQGYGNVAQGGLSTGAADQAIGTLSNANLGPAADVLGNIAQGGGYNLDDLFASVQSRVQPAIASQYAAAGRTPTGGAGYAESLSRGLTEGFAPFALQAAMQGVQNQLSAAGQLQNAYGQQLNAAAQGGQLGLSQAGMNAGNILAGLGGQGQLGESAFGRQFQAGQGLQDIFQQGLSNQLTGQQALQSQYQNQLANQLAGGQAMQGAFQNQQANQLAGAAGLQSAYGDQLNRLLQSGQLGMQQQGQNIATQLAGLQGAAGVAGQDIQNVMGALGGMSGIYDAERARMQQAMFGAPDLANQDYRDLAALSGVGAEQQQMLQDQINADMARWNYNQNIPYDQLARYMQMIQGTYGGTTQQSVPNPSTSQQVLGGILAGAGLLGGVGSLWG